MKNMVAVREDGEKRWYYGEKQMLKLEMGYIAVPHTRRTFGTKQHTKSPN